MKAYLVQATFSQAHEYVNILQVGIFNTIQAAHSAKQKYEAHIAHHKATPNPLPKKAQDMVFDDWYNTYPQYYQRYSKWQTLQNRLNDFDYVIILPITVNTIDLSIK